MSEFQESMSRLRDMINRSNELVEIKKEAGKIAFEKGKQKGRVEGAIKELVDLQHYICSDININEKDLLKFIDKRLKVLGGKE